MYRQVPLIRLRRITPSSPANHALHLVFVFAFVFVFVYALVFGLLCLRLCLRTTPGGLANHAWHTVSLYNQM